MFTSRPLRWFDEEIGLQKHVTRYVIRALTTAKITRFIEHICSQINLSKRLVEDIKKSQLFKQLPHSPIAAILLSNLLAQNANELPSNLTELYAKSLELMLGRWDIDKGLLTQKEYEASDRFCGELAKFMLDNGLDRIAKSEAEQMLRAYLDERNLGLEHEALFEKILFRTGVFALDVEKSVVFFKHRSFTEYLYARHMWRTSRLEIDKRVFDLYWLNTYFFYVGLHRDCAGLLAEILAYPATTEQERWLKILNMGNYFLAGYASPYSIVQKNLSLLFLEAGKLFQDIKAGKTSTKLDSLSEIMLLWLFQWLMRQSYGFEFFRKAIEGAAVQIDDDALVDTDTKVSSLFLLGLVGVDINEMEPLEFLVQKHGFDRLPLPMSLSISMEMEQKKELGRSQLLKKQSKKLRRLLRNSPELRTAIKGELEKPLALRNQNRDRPGLPKPASREK